MSVVSVSWASHDLSPPSAQLTSLVPLSSVREVWPQFSHGQYRIVLLISDRMKLTRAKALYHGVDQARLSQGTMSHV